MGADPGGILDDVLGEACALTDSTDDETSAGDADDVIDEEISVCAPREAE